jgi:hypothetical protein
MSNHTPAQPCRICGRPIDPCLIPLGAHLLCESNAGYAELGGCRCKAPMRRPDREGLLDYGQHTSGVWMPVWWTPAGSIQDAIAL